jgi:signal peptidase II
MITLSPRDWGLLTAASALILDQGTKLLLLYALHFTDLPPHESVPVLPFFNLMMVWNSGISYGLFPATGPLGTAVLALLSTAAVTGLGWWLWVSTRLTLTVGLGLVIGGALGNLIDRLVHGKVADFFHFYGLGYDWYVFNVADAAITFGVIALLYDALLRPQVHAAGGKSQTE